MVIFPPVDSVASELMPASTPTAVSLRSCCSTDVSTRRDTNHRSAASRDTVTVDGSAPSGRGRDHSSVFFHAVSIAEVSV
ncbi:hypothetical protein N599_36185 [Saccharopolyspora erythraea D]|nr:hypothetical protein N599_36185 [Saccharopolyspora erythraea D]